MVSSTLTERLNNNLLPINRVINALEEASKRGINEVCVYGDNTVNEVDLVVELEGLGLIVNLNWEGSLCWFMYVAFDTNTPFHLGTIQRGYGHEWPYSVQL